MIQRFFRNLRYLFTLDLHRVIWRLAMMEKSIRGVSAIALSAHEPGLPLHAPKPHSEVNKHEFRAYSQNGEDGILLWLFSQIGTGTKTFIEFGSGSGRECLAANLILNFGWKGLLMDGSEENVAEAKLFFKYLMPWSEYEQLEIRKEFVTKENIESLLASRKHQGEVDFLSIDIDGNDYWVWEAIESIKPRVSVIEYNASFGPTRSITVPYKPDFDAYAEQPLGLYHGVSVQALVKLGERKGYKFVGCDSNGANTFFVRNDLAASLESADPAVAFYDNQHKVKRGSTEAQWEKIKHLPVVEV